MRFYYCKTLENCNFLYSTGLKSRLLSMNVDLSDEHNLAMCYGDVT